MLKWLDIECIRESFNNKTHRYAYWIDYGMSVPNFFLNFIEINVWNQIFS
jgi:hypothetical protein